MSPLVVFILFFVFLLIAIPISVSLGLVAVLPGVFDPSFTASASYVIRSMFGGIDSFPLLAVPMFILSGIIMARGGISKRLFDLFSYFIGKRTAGLPCAAVITCLFYGAISGSGIATVAAVGSMTIPLLVELGYDKKFCTALVAVAGSLGVIIPPSMPFIIVKNMEKIKKRLMQRLMIFMHRDYGKYLRAVSLQCCLQSSSLDVFTPVLPLLQKQPLSQYFTH